MTNLAERVRQRNPAENPAIKAKAARLFADGGLQAVLDGLTGKQRSFVEEYVKDFNGFEALYRAGFQPKSSGNAKKMVAILLKHPMVTLSIRELSKERTKAAVVDVNYVLDQITQTIASLSDQRKDPKAASVLLRASELLARHLGMFIERTEISGPDGDAIKFQKTREDAADFTSSIARLAKRSGTTGVAEPANPGEAS